MSTPEQLAPGHLRWHLVPFASADPEELRRAIAARATLALGAGTSVTVQFTERIASTSEGKFVRAVVPREANGNATGASPHAPRADHRAAG